MLKKIRERNTPAGVGKTIELTNTDQQTQKHPHGRGEDYVNFIKYLTAAETPPRAWGRQCKLKPILL
ncbi:hypothetical protein BMETH_1574_0 [methanotrophic bacterial endosymbiont of Bathymodiolus sp.]|nr:hypothetical protein BMETH_1574_0 [methanotrophic bacterial endosymbiont of Bathymodiolus sp.]